MNASSEMYSAPKMVDIQVCRPSCGSILVNDATATRTIPTATSRRPLPVEHLGERGVEDDDERERRPEPDERAVARPT